MSLSAQPQRGLSLGVLTCAKIASGRITMSDRQTPEKRRLDRAYQRNHRGSKRSYVTEIENLRVLLAWEAGELSEGQAAKRLGLDRIDLRDMRIKVIAETVQ